MTRLACTLALPAGFRRGDLLAFHRRDPQGIAERVDDSALHKGIVWDGMPACLAVRFSDGAADAEIAIDGPAAGDAEARFRDLVRRLLGLSQDIAAFEAQYRGHPQLGPLIARHPGLRVPLAATPFEALTWAVTGQQISVAAAVALRRRLIVAGGVRHSDGLFCYPDAGRIAGLAEADLHDAGFSRSKAATLLGLARRVAADQLPLDAWLPTLPVDEIRAALLALRGIGPWTVDYTLLRGFGWLDGSLHGDAAVRRSLQRLLAVDAIGEAETRDWLAAFSPWRALVAAHLWANKSVSAY